MRVGGKQINTTLQRFGWAVLVSVLVNLILWWRAAGFVSSHVVVPPLPIEVQRIILPAVKPLKPVPQRKKIFPKSGVKQLSAPVSKPNLQAKPIVAAMPVMRPVTAHNRVLTSNTPVKVAANTLPGGHAQVGAVIEQQNPGQGPENAPPPPTPVPHIPEPLPTPSPKTEPEPITVPKTLPQTVSSGPTQDAQVLHQENPEIPEDLIQDNYQSSVRVAVLIDAAGKTINVTLRSFSGNAEVDQRVIEALKRWRWKPALQDGKPVASTKYFRFDFEVN